MSRSLDAARPAVSVVVVSFNMQRELPRTVYSLSRRIQRWVDDVDYEIIVVDNGSEPPLLLEPAEWLSLLRIDDAHPSPASAINRGLNAARGNLIGVMIDGARLVSPGLIAHAAMAARLHPRPTIATLGFHLGREVQQESVQRGYDARTEDQLLRRSGWESDGYRLFDTSVLAKSSRRGWFGPIAESNALFMPRAMWSELGGYEERFQLPGGGLVNLDTYLRACELPGAQLIVLLGEGTFHQVHGGVATNSLTPPSGVYQTEYRSIRGKPFRSPTVNPLYLGRVHPSTLRSIRDAADAEIGLAAPHV